MKTTLKVVYNVGTMQTVIRVIIIDYISPVQMHILWRLDFQYTFFDTVPVQKNKETKTVFFRE